jgi:hypothetical protein
MALHPSRDRASLEQWMWENHFPLSQTTSVYGVDYETDGYVFLEVGRGGYRIAYACSGLEGEMLEELARIKMSELSRAMSKSGFDFENRTGANDL